MSQQERWVVYPLLFLAIGMSFRDRLFPTHRPELEADEIRAIKIRCGDLHAADIVATNADRCKLLEADEIRVNKIRCVELHAADIVVTNADGRPLVHLGQVFETVGDKQVALPAGLVEILGRDGHPIAGLIGEQAGADGRLNLWSHSRNKKLTERAGAERFEEPIPEDSHPAEDKQGK